MTQRYRLMAKRLKLRSTRLHLLRHYSATELIAAGVDLHGRRPPRLRRRGVTTLKVYAAWVAEADRKAADTMATIIPKPAPAKPRSRGPYESVASPEPFGSTPR